MKELQTEKENSMLKDTDKITFGVHKGKALANVPAHYLLFIYENGYRMPDELKKYIEENKEVLLKEKKGSNGK